MICREDPFRCRVAVLQAVGAFIFIFVFIFTGFM